MKSNGGCSMKEVYKSREPLLDETPIPVTGGLGGVLCVEQIQ